MLPPGALGARQAARSPAAASERNFLRFMGPPGISECLTSGHGGCTAASVWILRQFPGCHVLWAQRKRGSLDGRVDLHSGIAAALTRVADRAAPGFFPFQWDEQPIVTSDRFFLPGVRDNCNLNNGKLLRRYRRKHQRVVTTSGCLGFYSLEGKGPHGSQGEAN